MIFGRMLKCAKWAPKLHSWDFEVYRWTFAFSRVGCSFRRLNLATNTHALLLFPQIFIPFHCRPIIIHVVVG